MKNTYTLGVDFGTLSARAVLASVKDGAVVASAAMDYPSGVITGQLPQGIPLAPSAALADVADYRQALRQTLRQVVQAGQEAGIRPDQIAAIADGLFDKGQSEQPELRKIADLPDHIIPKTDMVQGPVHGGKPGTDRLKRRHNE